MPIETSRLRLRHFTQEDFDDLFRLYSDAEVMRYLAPRTKSQTQASLCKHIAIIKEPIRLVLRILPNPP